MVCLFVHTAPIGVKRSSRFVKTKKRPTLKKCDKEKSKAPDIKVGFRLVSQWALF